MAPKAPDGNGNERRHSMWTENIRLFAVLLHILVTFLRLYVCLQLKKTNKFWEESGKFVKGIYSMMLKLSGTFHSSLAEILIFNCVHDYQRCQGNRKILSRFRLFLHNCSFLPSFVAEFSLPQCAIKFSRETIVMTISLTCN